MMGISFERGTSGARGFAGPFPLLGGRGMMSRQDDGAVPFAEGDNKAPDELGTTSDDAAPHVFSAAMVVGTWEAGAGATTVGSSSTVGPPSAVAVSSRRGFFGTFSATVEALFFVISQYG